MWSNKVPPLIASSFAAGQWRDKPADFALAFVLIGIFGFAGMFAQISEATRVQPSVLLLIGAMVLIGVKLSDSQWPENEASD